MARHHGGRRTKVGLLVSVHDGRVRARYNELSRYSTAPLLKARLSAEPAGTRIAGEIQWTNVIALPVATGLVSLVLVAVAVWSITEGSPILGLFYLLGGVASAP
jgi:hypothetical protein